MKDKMNTLEQNASNRGKHFCFSTSILMKILYFFVNGKEGSLTPFLTVFLTSVGLHIREASVIIGMQFVASILSSLLFGWLADRTGRRRLLFIILCIGAMVFLFPLPWIAVNVKKTREVVDNRTDLTTNGSYLHYYANGVFENNSIKVLLMDKRRNYELSRDHDLFSSRLFYVMLCTVFFGFLFLNPIFGFADSFVMSLINANPEKYDYGKQRLFGVLGFGGLTLLSGIVSDIHTKLFLNPYTGAFFCFLVSMIFLLPSGIILEKRCKIKIPKNDQTNRFSLLLKVLSNCDNVIFITSFLFAGIGNAAIVGFLFATMSNELNASKTIMGIGSLIASIAEIALLQFSSRFLRYFSSPIIGVELSILAFSLRFLLISYIRSPLLIIVTQVLNAPCFSLCWACAVEYTRKIAPPEIFVTMFSFLNNVFFNIAGLVCYLEGGVIYSQYGSKRFHLGLACIFGLWFFAIFTYYHVIKQCRNYVRLRNKIETNSSVESK